MKKALSLLFIASLCLIFLFGCAKNESDVPLGMTLASDPEINKEFTLYIPDGWTVDMSTGIVSAYVSSVDRSNISVVSQRPTELTIKDFWDKHSVQLSSVFEEFEILEQEVKTKLGNADAVSYTYKAKYEGKEYKFIQIFTISGSSVDRQLLTFTYTALSEETELGYVPFDRNLDSVYKIIENFKLN